MWAFRAMNTDITVAAPELPASDERAFAAAAEELFRVTEERFSRFHPDSELARFNAATGPQVVSGELLALLLRARAHVHATRGLFEPAVGGAMRANGYDRSFAPGALDDASAAASVAPTSIRMLQIDPQTRTVIRPPSVHLDFGGFLKGHTADRAARLATGAVVVDAGGDVVLRGAPAGEPGWTVYIEDPDDDSRSIGSVVVRDRAIATSAGNRRRWTRGTRTMHHLIDPRTSAPASTDVVQVTVLAPTAELADVLAKVAFVAGFTTAREELARREVAGVFVLRDRSVRTVGDVELHHA